MEELKWEDIKHGMGFSMRRTKIFGGWLVTTIDEVRSPFDTGYTQPEYKEGYEWRTSITFVPDLNHEWKLD
jgi:hypothetical protein